ISSQASRRRNIGAKRVADGRTQSLITGEVEEFVFYDPAACHAAVLLQLGGQLVLGGTVEEVAGGPVGIAAKRVRRAVQGVGPRLDPHVHYGAGLPAVLRFRIFLEV